jgi:predicted nicotinamide N-methyase
MAEAARLPQNAPDASLPSWLRAMVEFVHDNTQPTGMPLVPEITLRLAFDSVILWDKIERQLDTSGAGPPYWAFAWAGGQALARHILDHPHLVAGRRVLDVASGSGLIALAAAKAGARHVIANDVDLLSIVALSLNAGVNECEIEANPTDLLAPDQTFDPSAIDVLLLGDVFYERNLAGRAWDLMQCCHAAGCLVLSGDPGRAHLPIGQLAKVCEHNVPVTRDCQYISAKGATVGLDLVPGTVWTPRANM